MSKYSLSFIVAIRNDNHGGNMRQKIQTFINNWIHLVNKFKVNYELIIIDWNSPSVKGPIRKKFKFENLKKNSSIKIIEINKKDLSKTKQFLNLDFYQMIAKNIGSKCALSDTLLLTNIDIIFTEKIFKKLSNLKVKSKEIYRAVRYDINLNKFNNLNEDLLLKKVIRINYPQYTYDLINKKKFKIKISFFEYFKKLFNYEFYKILFKINIFSLIKTFNIFYNSNLFTNACGDFILINKNFFLKLGGFYEFNGYSWNLDNLFLWQAYFNNAKFKILKEKIYHVDHKIGSGFTAGNKALFKKLKKQEINYINNFQLFELINKLRIEKKSNLNAKKLLKINFSQHEVS